MQIGSSSQHVIIQSHQKLNLKQQNLIPFYVIEDSLKSNFNQIQQFINTQYGTNSTLQQKIHTTNQALKTTDIQYQKQFITMQNNIFNNIKTEIQTTVSHILNKKLSSIIQTISTFQSKQSQKQLALQNHLNQMAKTLKFQIAQQNQKYFTKEITKIQKDFDKKVHSITEETINSIKQFNTFNKINKTRKQDLLKDEKQQIPTQQTNQTFNIVSQNLNKQVIEVLKNKVQKLQQYRTQLDKKFIQNFSTLKSSWKLLGTEMLDNKKLINKKVQQLNIDVIQLKNIAEFNSLPQTTDQTFKKKIMQKFTDLYSMVSTFTTKAESDMVNERTKTILSRHTQEISSLREQFQKNTEYFTFYINNSNSDDLKQTINKLKQDILKDKKYVNTVIEDIQKNSNQGQKTIEQLVKSLGSIQMTSETMQGKIQKIILNVEKVSDKIRTLEDLNDIDPFKMKKIHSALDHQINFSDSQPSLNQLQKLNANNAQTNRELKKQLQQLKDQLFVLASQKNMITQTQHDQIIELKNQIKSLYQKLQKVRTQAEEAHLTRKPWILLGDKNSPQLHSQRDSLKKLQKDSSKKKISLENGKSGGYFANDKSQKNIGYKLSPSPQDNLKYMRNIVKNIQVIRQSFHKFLSRNWEDLRSF